LFEEDIVSIYEEVGRKAMIFFPHTPFGESSVHAFGTSTSEYNYYASMQVFDIFVCLAIVYLTDNFFQIKSSFSHILGKKKSKKYKPYQKLHYREDVELSEHIHEEKSSENVRNRKKTGNSSSDEDRLKPVREPSIQYIDMTKKFGSFTAVDSMNLNLYKDEIFCFLGHNGAGKTTSLNVLMGKE
jgi:ABC-type siderophore export system fused ATPase/permease subunit